jgi:hypothetical protein
MLSLVTAIAFAAAHSDTESVATLELAPDRTRVTFLLDTARIMEACQAKPPLGEDWSDGDVAAIAEKACAYVDSHWRLTRSGSPVALVADGVALHPTNDPMTGLPRNVQVEVRFRAPPLRDVEVELLVTLLEEFEPNHHHFVVEKGGDGQPLSEFAVVPHVRCRFFLTDIGEGATARRLRAQVVAGARAAVREPWLAALLLALLVAPLARRARFASFAAALAGAAIAFAATRAGWIAPAAWAARAAATFSIAYVAVENWRSDPVRLRLPTAALFGLVQGMALAPLALVAGRSTGASEAAAFVAVALLVACAAAVIVAAIVRLGAGSSPGRPNCTTVANLILLVVGAGGVAFVLWTRSRR